MKTKEEQIGELLANSLEDHFFNPAALGRYLADQPTYTIDRIMEVVAWVIEKQARRYDREVETNGTISEGLAIASKLDLVIDKIKEQNELKSVKLPITTKERRAIVKALPKAPEQSYRYSWLHETNNGSKATNIVQATI
jgi:hypothetical protein